MNIVFTIVEPIWPMLQNISQTMIYSVHTCRGVETLSWLPDILTYFHHSCPAPHILCIQSSFNLPDICLIYRTMSCMTGCFHTSAYMYMYMMTWDEKKNRHLGQMIEKMKNELPQVGFEPHDTLHSRQILIHLCEQVNWNLVYTCNMYIIFLEYDITLEPSTTLHAPQSCRKYGRRKNHQI